VGSKAQRRMRLLGSKFRGRRLIGSSDLPRRRATAGIRIQSERRSGKTIKSGWQPGEIQTRTAASTREKGKKGVKILHQFQQQNCEDGVTACNAIINENQRRTESAARFLGNIRGKVKKKQPTIRKVESSNQKDNHRKGNQSRSNARMQRCPPVKTHE